MNFYLNLYFYTHVIFWERFVAVPQKTWLAIRLDHIKGSHHIMRKGDKKIVIPIHSNKDLPKGTYNALLKQAGLYT